MAKKELTSKYIIDRVYAQAVLEEHPHFKQALLKQNYYSFEEALDDLIQIIADVRKD
jgi:hypothetical protein